MTAEDIKDLMNYHVHAMAFYAGQDYGTFSYHLKEHDRLYDQLKRLR